LFDPAVPLDAEEVFSQYYFQYIGHVRGINSLKKATGGIVEGVRHHAFE